MEGRFGREGLQQPAESLEAAPQISPSASIREIRAIDRTKKSTGHELIIPEEEKERNLQNAFVEVLAASGVPFDTAFEIADVAWDVHRQQVEKRNNPSEPLVPRELTDEERERKERWEAMSQEERDAEGRAIWERLDRSPGFRRSMRKGISDMENGRYYSMDVLSQVDRIPKLKVVKKSADARRWEEYEKRIPGLRKRLIQAHQDLKDGKGSVLMPDGTLIPIQEYRAQFEPQVVEQVLVDNFSQDEAPIQE